MTSTATATTAAPKPEYKAMSLAFSMPERHKSNPKWPARAQSQRATPGHRMKHYWNFWSYGSGEMIDVASRELDSPTIIMFLEDLV